MISGYTLQKKSNRRILREKALQILYAFQMSGEGLDNIINGVLSDVTNSADREFCSELVYKVLANKKSLQEQIKERVTNWEMDRIAVMDILLLEIGITELMNFPDIPPKVSINEVIEIAKDYSTSNSGKFINGILDSILSDLKKKGKLKKVGRGLIDQSISPKSK